MFHQDYYKIYKRDTYYTHTTTSHQLYGVVAIDD